MSEFREFQKIPRLYREVIVTEKIDGTNGCVVVSDDMLTASAQSRSQPITVANDNFGFAKWVAEHHDELLTLGPGYHYGEWWGAGIQRRYGLTEKRFSLFNIHRWAESRPACCHVVPVIISGMPCDSFGIVAEALDMLRKGGSYAAPGFMKPEGVVAFHKQGNVLFKATLEKDEEWKGKSLAAHGA